MDPVTLSLAISAAASLVNEGIKLMEERRRKRELTPEEEAAWDKVVSEKLNAPHWKPSTAPH